jgi:sarcosine oxidase gamma subunit
VLSVLGAEPSHADAEIVDDERPLTEHVHVAFHAQDDATVRAFRAAAAHPHGGFRPWCARSGRETR